MERNPNKILQKLKEIKAQIKELETMLRTNNDTYTIIAGWNEDSALTGLIDLHSMITYSGPKSVKSDLFRDMPEADKFRAICRGVFNAIGMIPPTVLGRYLQDDGPQIVLKMSNPDVFEKWESDPEMQELAVTMLDHIKNYRIKLDLLSDEYFQELLED